MSRDFAHQAPQEGSFLETDTTGHGPCRELYRLAGQEMIQGKSWSPCFCRIDHDRSESIRAVCQQLCDLSEQEKLA